MLRAAVGHVFGRWLYRFRYVLLIGGILYVALRALWWLIRHPPLLGMTVVFVAGTVQWGWRWGLTDAGIALLAGIAAWIALIAERGTARGLRAILLGVSRLVRVRRIWGPVCEEARLVSHVTKTPLPARRWRITQRGLECDVALGALAMHEAKFGEHLAGLQSALYVDRVRQHAISSGLAKLSIEWGNHLRTHLALADIPESERLEQGYLSIGKTEDGLPFEAPIGISMLAAGMTGAGKSSFVWAVVYALVRSNMPFRLRIVDPKHVEWAIAREHAGDSPIVHRYTSSPMDYGERGLRANGWMDELSQDLERRLKNIPVGTRMHRGTDEEPWDIVIIDEGLPLAKGLRKAGVEHPLSEVTYKGRAAGTWMIFLTQIAEKEVLGPVRDMIPFRVCFKAPNADFTRVVLGDDAVRQGAIPHLLDPIADRGVCYAIDEFGKCFAARIGYATDEDTRYLIMGEMPRVGASIDKYEARECAVYYHYAPDGELLYIGNAYDPWKRMDQHRLKQPWWGEVDEGAMRVEWWPTKASAEVEEASEIRRLGPKYNKTFNGGRVRVSAGSREDDAW